MSDLIPIVGIVFGVLTVIIPMLVGGYVLYVFLSNRSKERLLMIEKGVALPTSIKTSPERMSMLRNGCVIIGVALGFFIGMILQQFLTFEGYFHTLFAPCLSLLFAGIGFIVYFLITKEDNKKKKPTTRDEV